MIDDHDLFFVESSLKHQPSPAPLQSLPHYIRPLLLYGLLSTSAAIYVEQMTMKSVNTCTQRVKMTTTR
jgi:hypothetical protein